MHVVFVQEIIQADSPDLCLANFTVQVIELNEGCSPTALSSAICIPHNQNRNHQPDDSLWQSFNLISPSHHVHQGYPWDFPYPSTQISIALYEAFQRACSERMMIDGNVSETYSSNYVTLVCGHSIDQAVIGVCSSV